MMRTLRASRAQVFYNLGILRAVPYFFASLRVAVAGAFIGNVVGEMLAAGEGLSALFCSARVRSWPDPEAPTASPAGPLTEVDLPCRRSEWHGSF
jgi:ABC-type nitrate/sulfonate/bicarbonate transport system permease component